MNPGRSPASPPLSPEEAAAEVQKRRAERFYDRLCWEFGSLWRHMPGGLLDGGCESFEAWFRLSDGADLEAMMDAGIWVLKGR